MGLIAGVTKAGVAPEEAVTALVEIAKITQGAGTPEQRRILEAAGICGGNFMQTLRQMSSASQSGALSGVQLQTVFGSNAKLAGNLASPRTLAMAEAAMASVVAAGGDDVSRSAAMMGAVFASEPRLTANQVERVAEAETTLIRSRDEIAANAAAARDMIARELERARTRGDVSDAEIAAIVPQGGRDVFDRVIAEGFSPAEAALLAERRAMTDDFDAFGMGVSVDLSSAVIEALGSQAFRSNGQPIRSGFMLRANTTSKIFSCALGVCLVAPRPLPRHDAGSFQGDPTWMSHSTVAKMLRR